MYIYVHICLSLSVCPSVRVSVSLSVCVYVSLSVCVSVSLSVCVSVSLSVCVSVSLSVCVSVSLSICWCISLYLCFTVCRLYTHCTCAYCMSLCVRCLSVRFSVYFFVCACISVRYLLHYCFLSLQQIYQKSSASKDRTSLLLSLN